MGRVRGLIVGALLLWLAAVMAQAQTPRFEPVSEGDDFPSSASGERVDKGYLVVLQDRADPQSLELRLPVIRIRAEASTGAPPVLFVSGGPGVGDLSAARFPGAYPFTASRDFLVMGRRGTRHAQPSMRCSEIGPLLSGPQDDLNAAIDACRSEAMASGIALEAYNSAASAADIEDLRQALGYQQISLFSLSYGTRVALTFARDFPDSIEAMMLDSPLPHSARYDDESPASYEAALRQVASACAQDARCDEAYPDLENRFFDRVRRETTVDLPPLSNRSDLARAPQEMDRFARNGPKERSEAAGGASDFDWGPRLSVWCSDAFPYSRRSESEPTDAFAGLDGAVFQPETCLRWDVPTRPREEVASTESDVPTLIIAGQFDILTPPAWGARAAQTLTNARVIEVTAGFHSETTNWGGDGCVMSLVGEFFEDPLRFSNEAGVPRCISAQDYPSFVVD